MGAFGGCPQGVSVNGVPVAAVLNSDRSLLERWRKGVVVGLTQSERTQTSVRERRWEYAMLRTAEAARADVP